MITKKKRKRVLCDCTSCLVAPKLVAKRTLRRHHHYDQRNKIQHHEVIELPELKEINERNDIKEEIPDHKEIKDEPRPLVSDHELDGIEDSDNLDDGEIELEDRDVDGYIEAQEADDPEIGENDDDNQNVS